MVLVKLRCPPGAEEATVGVRITTSPPTLSLSSLKSSSPEPVLAIQVHLRCLSSTNPSKSVTILKSGTVFDSTKPESGHLDNLARGVLGGAGLVCRNSPDKKFISFGFFKTHHARQDDEDSDVLSERPGASFITIPSQNSGEEVIVSHTLTSERLFAYSEKVKADDLRQGEIYGLTLQDDYVGTAWWCWGGLDNELKGKKLHAFSKGFCLTGFPKEPSEEEMEKEGFVCGEAVAHLQFTIDEDGNSCAVEVVD